MNQSYSMNAAARLERKRRKSSNNSSNASSQGSQKKYATFKSGDDTEEIRDRPSFRKKEKNKEVDTTLATISPKNQKQSGRNVLGTVGSVNLSSQRRKTNVPLYQDRQVNDEAKLVDEPFYD